MEYNKIGRIDLIHVGYKYFCMDDCLHVASYLKTHFKVNHVYQYFLFCLSRALKIFATHDVVCFFPVKISVNEVMNYCRVSNFEVIVINPLLVVARVYIHLYHELKSPNLTVLNL